MENFANATLICDRMNGIATIEKCASSRQKKNMKKTSWVTKENFARKILSNTLVQNLIDNQSKLTKIRIGD